MRYVFLFAKKKAIFALKLAVLNQVAKVGPEGFEPSTDRCLSSRHEGRFGFDVLIL